jgi:hypothetical protein
LWAEVGIFPVKQNLHEVLVDLVHR